MEIREERRLKTEVRQLLAKFAEIAALGIFVALALVFFSSTWIGSKYYFIDSVQKMAVHADFPPLPNDFPFHITAIDIDDVSCRKWADWNDFRGCYAMAELPQQQLLQIVEGVARSAPANVPSVLAFDIFLPRTLKGAALTEPQQRLRDAVFKATGARCGEAPVSSEKTPATSGTEGPQLHVIIPVPLYHQLSDEAPGPQTVKPADSKDAGASLKGDAGSSSDGKPLSRFHPTIFHCIDGNESNPNVSDPIGRIEFAHAEQLIDSDGIFRRTLFSIPIGAPDVGSRKPDPADPGGSPALQALSVQTCLTINEFESFRQAPLKCPSLDPKDKDGAIWTKYLMGTEKVLPHIVAPEKRKFHAGVTTYTADRFTCDPREAACTERAYDLPSLLPEGAGRDALIVIVGSSASSRRDALPTPIDVGGHETPGLVVMVNQVAGALTDQSLQKASLVTKVIEKSILITVMASLAVLLYWRGYYRRRKTRPLTLPNIVAVELPKFFFMVVAVFFVCFVIVLFLSVKTFDLGEISDPAGLIVALVIDFLIEIGAPLGHAITHKIVGAEDDH